METIIHSKIGLLHAVASLISLITGSLLLAKTKGTQIHKIIGYTYATSMLFANATAFGLFGLFGMFGPFHVAALISLSTLSAGMIPVIFRTQNWLTLHLSFMYYSVIGLYAAFASEIIVRIPGISFGPAVGIATALVMLMAVIVFRFLQPKWIKQFS